MLRFEQQALCGFDSDDLNLFQDRASQNATKPFFQSAAGYEYRVGDVRDRNWLEVGCSNEPHRHRYIAVAHGQNVGGTARNQANRIHG